MVIKFTGLNEDPSRQQKISEILPEQDLISAKLEKEIEKKLFPVLTRILKEELEIYRKYPKRMEAPPKEEIKTFDPTDNKTCFMGKGFQANTHITDSELVQYRKRIGTIDHPNWGNCTLLEIWGGDHFISHPEMVKAAFAYGTGLRKTMPPLRFHVNPLYFNKKTGKRKLNKEEEAHKEEMELLLAKAMFYGVNEPKKRKKS